MDILILADRSGDALSPLTAHLPVPLLPLAGRPLIDHTLEALATCSGLTVRVIIGLDDQATATHLNDTGWPGLELSVERLPVPRVPRPSLVIRGDMLRPPQVLSAAIRSTLQGQPIGNLVHLGILQLTPDMAVPVWRDVAGAAAQWPIGWGPTGTLPFDTPQDYHFACIAAARGRLTGLSPAGWVGEDGVRTGLGTRVLTRTPVGKAVTIGAQSWIGPDVQIEDDVVIGDRCVIGRGARLGNCIVLPNSFVGAGLVVRDAVIAGPTLTRLRAERSVIIEDRRLLGRIAA